MSSMFLCDVLNDVPSFPVWLAANFAKVRRAVSCAPSTFATCKKNDPIAIVVFAVCILEAVAQHGIRAKTLRFDCAAFQPLVQPPRQHKELSLAVAPKPPEKSTQHVPWCAESQVLHCLGGSMYSTVNTKGMAAFQCKVIPVLLTRGRFDLC